MKFFNSEGIELSYSDALTVVMELILEEKRTIWDDFIDMMNQYYRRYYPEGCEFVPSEMDVLDESRMYSNNREVTLDIWFKYEVSGEGDSLYHVIVNRMPYRSDVEIFRYDLAHRTSFDIEDSQESHTV